MELADTLQADPTDVIIELSGLVTAEGFREMSTEGGVAGCNAPRVSF